MVEAYKYKLSGLGLLISAELGRVVKQVKMITVIQSKLQLFAYVCNIDIHIKGLSLQTHESCHLDLIMSSILT